MAGQCFWPLWLPGWSRAIAWVALPMSNPMGSEYVCELHVELCSYGYGGTKKKKKKRQAETGFSPWDGTLLSLGPCPPSVAVYPQNQQDSELLFLHSQQN